MDYEDFEDRGWVSFASRDVLSTPHRLSTVQALSPEGLWEHRREESEPRQEELVVRELGLRKCQECWEDRRGLSKCRKQRGGQR